MKRLCFIFLILLSITSCHQEKSQPNRDDSTNTLTSSVSSEIIVRHRALKTMAIPHALKYTDFIGTEDHPTFDGGILNAADGEVIQHYEVTPAIIKHITTRTSQKQPIITAPNEANEKNSQTAFSDQWATSSHLKTLLYKIAQQGKLDYVLKKADSLNMPASVAIIPVVESRYNDQAVSPKGAIGAWQLMPQVAKAYALNDSTNFTLATDTALQLLNQLHEQFGNWELAFAAYNAGTGKIQRALLANPHAKTISELPLPHETKQYLIQLHTLSQTLIQQSL